MNVSTPRDFCSDGDLAFERLNCWVLEIFGHDMKAIFGAPD
jgi:hypothetical protein